VSPQLRVPLEFVSTNLIVCSLDDRPWVIFTFNAEYPVYETTADVVSMITWPPNRTTGPPESVLPPARASAMQIRVLKPKGLGACADAWDTAGKDKIAARA
jgi:hypothetical protein